MRKLQELQTGDVVNSRLGRAVDTVMCECGTRTDCDKCAGSGQREATGPAWGPWMERTIYVQRDKPTKGQPQICTLAIRGTGFAEFDPRRDVIDPLDDDAPGTLTLMTEDYLMQIQELER